MAPHVIHLKTFNQRLSFVKGIWTLDNTFGLSFDDGNSDDDGDDDFDRRRWVWAHGGWSLVLPPAPQHPTASNSDGLGSSRQLRRRAGRRGQFRSLIKVKACVTEPQINQRSYQLVTVGN